MNGKAGVRQDGPCVAGIAEVVTTVSPAAEVMEVASSDAVEASTLMPNAETMSFMLVN